MNYKEKQKEYREKQNKYRVFYDSGKVMGIKGNIIKKGVPYVKSTVKENGDGQNI